MRITVVARPQGEENTTRPCGLNISEYKCSNICCSLSDCVGVLVVVAVPSPVHIGMTSSKTGSLTAIRVLFVQEHVLHLEHGKPTMPHICSSAVRLVS